VERVAESNWFFRLSAHRDFLHDLLRTRPDFVQPSSRHNEILAFVERGIEDVSITRASLDWGIPFPVAARDGRHQAIYVWFDALPSYLTSTGWPHRPIDVAWPAQVHVVGKDITRFHCVLWPAVLHAAGLPLPERVWAHGFVRANGARLSKTAGVWIDLDDAIARHGADALRYFLLREIPFDSDGDFSWERFDARYVSDLANTLGNLSSRVTALIARSYDGRVPARPSSAVPDTVAADVQTLAERDAEGERRYGAAFDAFLPHDALGEVWETLAAGNEFVTRVAPWRLARDPEHRAALDESLWWLVRVLARQAVLLSPILPAKADELWKTLGGPGSVHEQQLGTLGRLDPGGWHVAAGRLLFPRTRDG
jgi:methionyl-tRNA synthetase